MTPCSPSLIMIRKPTHNKSDTERFARPRDEFPKAIGIELHPPVMSDVLIGRLIDFY